VVSGRQTVVLHAQAQGRARGNLCHRRRWTKYSPRDCGRCAGIPGRNLCVSRDSFPLTVQPRACPRSAARRAQRRSSIARRQHPLGSQPERRVAADSALVRAKPHWQRALILKHHRQPGRKADCKSRYSAAVRWIQRSSPNGAPRSTLRRQLRLAVGESASYSLPDPFRAAKNRSRNVLDHFTAVACEERFERRHVDCLADEAHGAVGEAGDEAVVVVAD